MPKKALVRSVEVWKTINQASEFGASVKEANLQWKKVMARKNEIIGKFVGGKGPYLEKMGVDLAYGAAEFTSPNTLKVGEQEYSGERILIGTGSRPFFPDIPGMEHTITSKEIFQMDSLPTSVAILGGGVISLEFAHIFANAGVEVTVVQRSDRLLTSQDEETSSVIKDISERQGIKVLTNTSLEKIVNDNDTKVLHVNQSGTKNTFQAEVVLTALGRTPNLEQLNLEAANIEYSTKGINVNDYFQTTNPAIYAAGDSIGGLMLTPVASYEAKIAARNAMKGNHHQVNYQHVPHTIFTMPPVASVGLTEQEATEKGISYEVKKSKLRHNGVAIILGEKEGYMKLISEKGTGKLLGAHMVGVHADEIIHQMAIALKANMTLADLADVIHVHPTISEAFIEMAKQ
jgi:pyruvate/2-oxoglutarate dehydrogenase complex dihydrolipoamide dehydrogenase (E3) component